MLFFLFVFILYLLVIYSIVFYYGLSMFIFCFVFMLQNCIISFTYLHMEMYYWQYRVLNPCFSTEWSCLLIQKQDIHKNVRFVYTE